MHLNPRPLAKDAKPSTKAKFGASCEACGRYLQDMPNRYCSIACKVIENFKIFGLHFGAVYFSLHDSHDKVCACLHIFRHL